MSCIKRITGISICVVLLSGLCGRANAASSKTVTLRASVPVISGVTLNAARATGAQLASLGEASTLDFGTLIFDSVNHIFTASDYFAVDIGIENNSGPWTLTHTPSSIYNRTTGNTSQNLDTHINVTFVNQLDDTQANMLSKVSFANSAATFTSGQISTGWIRVYYGVGTGGPEDNPGVTPILQTQPAGAYQGAITITVTP